jgi:esterase/lipase superfamily enzyme
VRVRFLFPCVVASAVSGCMLPRQVDASIYESHCDTTGSPADGTLLFVTARLPDCRDPSQLNMTWLRGDQLHYGAADSRHVVHLYSEKAWWDSVNARLQAAKLGPVVYIHGYNTSNANALARAAAVQTAAGDGHVVIAFTWPSYARVSKYGWDEANAEWSINQAGEILSRLTALRSDLIIVAHSMGNRLAWDLLTHDQPNPYKVKIARLIMASPDIDRAEVARLRGVGLGIPVTLYGSTRDQALSASWRWHGYARAGDLSSWVTGHQPDYSLFNLPSVDIVDTSNFGHGYVHHADFIETPEGAADLCRVVNNAGPEQGRAKVEQYPGRWILLEKQIGDQCERQGTAAAEKLAHPG